MSFFKKGERNQVKNNASFILAFTSFSHMAFYTEKSATNENETTYYNVLFLIS